MSVRLTARAMFTRSQAGLPVAVLLLAASRAAGQPQDPVRITLPPVEVTAQKEPADPQSLPIGVTVVSNDWLTSADIRTVSEAGWFSPNTFFSDFSARKLSNPRMRGVGASPANPGVTSYIDGVPQLHSNSSSVEFIDVDQVEFVRGPQSALFGRNALGGIINISSRRPSLKKWSGSAIAPFGNFGGADVRAAASGPLVADKLAVAVGFGHARRGGFTANDITGNDLDSRSASFGKAQLLWKPNARWQARALFSGERARDGDYALSDLGGLRTNPFHAARDFEGYTRRNIRSQTVQAEYTGSKIDFATTTGFLHWDTADLTDLDYTPLPLIRRSNDEKDFQFTEEARVSSSTAAPIVLSPRLTMKWQAGVVFFAQDYEQEAVNNYAPMLLSEFITFPVAQHSPQATLEDRGVGFYGQTTWTFSKALDVVVGARADREHRTADLRTFYSPAIAPASVVTPAKDFTDLSPQFAVAYRVQPRTTVFGTATRGFKAGGFNAASPAGAEAFDEEHTWSYEGGVKTSAFSDRLRTSISAFYVDWSDIQVNVPNVLVPGQFFIANAAGATSSGLEIELHARADRDLDLFGGAGIARARFSDGSRSNGVDVGGNSLANAPTYTADFGVQYSRPLVNGLALTGRAEIICYGDYQYDDANTAGQGAYTLSHFRGGVRGRHAFGEVWVRNAFDSRYIPIAFPYPGLAPSGFVGEMGAPRTFGVRFGVGF